MKNHDLLTVSVPEATKSLHVEFLTLYCDFSLPQNVWILTGISRRKDNLENPLFHRIVTRRVLTCAEEIPSAYDDIVNQFKDPETIYRMYVSLNARNVVKALFNFQKRLVDIGMGLALENSDSLPLTKKLASLWKTELEQSSCRGTKRFLLDIDNDMSVNTYNAVRGFFVHHYSAEGLLDSGFTDSGMFFVFNACDTRKLMQYCKDIGLDAQLHRDSLLYVGKFTHD